MTRIWDQYITDRDKQIFGAAGFAQPAGFGKRPALVIIDATYSFCGDRPEPVMEAVKRWPNSSGEEAWSALGHIRRLIDACRRKGVPVFYTVPDWREDGWDAGSWLYKTSRMKEDVENVVRDRLNVDPNAVVAEIAPEPQDVVVLKLKPSGFHGTPMRSLLHLLNVDTLIMTGGTTSGCVRATVIDAFSENFRVAISEEGCFDRAQASHAINLLDMNAKYADVRATDDLIAYIDGLPDGLFELPGPARKG